MPGSLPSGSLRSLLVGVLKGLVREVDEDSRGIIRDAGVRTGDRRRILGKAVEIDRDLHVPKVLKFKAAESPHHPGTEV